MILSENIEKYFEGFFSVDEKNPYLTADFVGGIETIYLQGLLGVDSFFELKSDLINGVAQSQKWKDFINGKIYEIDNIQIDYTGIIDMLQGFVYYAIYKLQSVAQTSVGNQRLDTKNSTKTTYLQNEHDYFKRYNHSCKLYKKAIDFVYFNNDKIEKTATLIIDNFNGIYTVSSNINNILNYSRVFFNNKYYSVSNITASTFDISEVPGVIFDLNFHFYYYNNLKSKILIEKQQITY